MGNIKAIAYLNELTKDVPDDYYLLPQVKGTLHYDDIIHRLEGKEIATKNVNGKAFVDLFLKECAIAVSEGYNVVTGLFSMSVSIKGSILSNQLGHSISAGKLNIRCNFLPGAYARELIGTSTTVEVAEQPAPTGPVIQKISNPVGDEANVLQTGDMVLIEGLRIAVRGEQADRIGVFFVNAETAEAVHITANRLSPNTPTKLQFVMPSGVTAGEWRVRIATQASSSSSVLTKDVREFEFPQLVTVV